jgi:hypothetical protein
MKQLFQTLASEPKHCYSQQLLAGETSDWSTLWRQLKLIPGKSTDVGVNLEVANVVSILVMQESIFQNVTPNFGVVVVMGGGPNSLEGVLHGIENNLQVVVRPELWSLLCDPFVTVVFVMGSVGNHFCTCFVFYKWLTGRCV